MEAGDSGPALRPRANLVVLRPRDGAVGLKDIENLRQMMRA